jgi:hypothetical protein
MWPHRSGAGFTKAMQIMLSQTSTVIKSLETAIWTSQLIKRKKLDE